jgi:hypothetical protein
MAQMNVYTSEALSIIHRVDGKSIIKTAGATGFKFRTVSENNGFYLYTIA